MSRRAKKRRESDENGRANEKLMERVSLGLTLVAVSAFAIFAGYLVGQYAIAWVAAPLITEPQGESARPEAASTPFREDVEPARDPSPVSTRPAVPPPAAAQGAAGGTSAGSAAASSSSPSGGPSSPSTAASAPAQSMNVYRVQVGRYATRGEAEAVAERLRSGRPAVPDAWVLFDQGAGAYRVQAGAFTARERALELASELSGRGFEAFVVP